MRRWREPLRELDIFAEPIPRVFVARDDRGGAWGDARRFRGGEQRQE
jgi:hypothetical protein